MEDLISKIEAVLFIYGEPLSVEKIAEFVVGEKEEVAVALGLLSEKLNKAQNSGLAILQTDKEYQIVTKPEYGKTVEGVIKSKMSETLSPVAIETLSLIAYLSPISRAELDFIRGVNSSFILRNLLLTGLIERVVDDKKLNSYLYRPTAELLKYLGVLKVSDLPEYEKYRDILAELQKNKQEALG